MDLELQILRDKVIEDEKNSGIGSLYDDDKTSHQHIQKLKEKYAQMRKDFEKTMTALGKQLRKAKGQEFVLDAQIKVMKEQRQKLKDQEMDFHQENSKDQHTTTKEVNTFKTEVTNLTNDLTKFATQLAQASATHHDHKMSQAIEKESDTTNMARHDQYVDLMEKLIKVKKEEEKKAIDDQKKID